MLGEGNGTGDFHAVPGFTALSAIGHRCHVGGIGFDHESLERQRCSNGAQFGILLESKVARKTDMSARVDNALSGFKCSAEAVHYKADFAGIFAFENFERCGFCIAGMDDKRFLRAACSFNVPAKTIALPVQGFLAPIKIEPGFADRNHAGF